MKKILLIILIFLPMLIFAGTVIPSGPVSGNWDLEGSPYTVVGDIYIAEADALTIQAGVEVLFNGWFKLEVFGSLMAEGETSNEIHFTSSAMDIKWRGIRFMETAAPSLLDHCIVEYARAEIAMYAEPENCGGGILCYKSPNASIIIRNSKIQNNEALRGGGIMVWDSKPLIENCEIKHNDAWRGGGIELYASANAEIKLTKVSYNGAETDGGGIYLNNCQNFSLVCNQIGYNTAALGAGLFFTYANGNMCSNTIAKNTSTANGGGIYFHIASSPSLVNCLIYFNTDGNKAGSDQVFMQDMNCDPDFSHCNIYGGMEGFEGFGAGVNYNGDYLDCIDGDPLFQDASFGNLSITWENYPYDDQTKSPCIDNGCSSQGLDPDKSCCDIGATCYFQILDTPVDLMGNLAGPCKFVASWEESYGALGYLLDVSFNHSFTNLLYENKLVKGTEYWVKLYEPVGLLFFRVRSYNTALTSEYSEEFMVIGMSVDDNDKDAVKIYSSSSGLQIHTGESITNTGETWIYNTYGQLLGHYNLKSGLNTLELNVSQQIIIVKALVEGEVYQQKLLLH